MPRIRKAALSGLITLMALPAAQAAPADEAIDPLHPDFQGATAVLDAWLDGERDFRQIPGLSAGIVVDQSLVWSEGYGYANLQDSVPADEDTIYSICSISKLFTSIGVMQLRDAGELRLDDPVADHLEFYDLEQAHDGGPVTIEGMLTHSSGLPRESDFFYWNEPDFAFPTREQLIDALSDQQTLYPARTYSQYSNLGLSLAGEIVAARSGVPFEEYVQGAILDPLGLEDTRPRYPTELRGGQLAVGYTGLTREGGRDEVPPFYTRGVTPAAGFTSSVRDLAAFASWQFRLLESGGTEVLEANTLREMHRVHWVSPEWDTTWGIGFSVRKADDGNYSLVGHGGGCPGYITFFVMAPKHKLAAIVLTNAGDGPAARLAMGLMKTMVQVLPLLDTEPDETVPDLAMYEGNYLGQPWGGETAIRQWGDQLVVIGLPADDITQATNRLKQVDGPLFVRMTQDGEEREPWTFEMGEDGKAASVRRHRFRMVRIR